MSDLFWALAACACLLQTTFCEAAPPLPVVNRSAMERPFADGVLPHLQSPPPGNLDTVAATLAKNIGQGGAEAVPSLETALLLAGFAIRGPLGAGDSSILALKMQGQGLVFEGWEIAAMAKNFANHRSVGLESFGKALSSGIPSFRKIPIAAGLVAAVRSNSESREPAQRFLARLLLELGRHSDRPYDLLSKELQLNQVTLDAIQTPLILARMIGDLASFDVHRGTLKLNPLNDDQHWQFAPAIFIRAEEPRLVHIADTKRSGTCSIDEQSGLILDAYSAAQSTFFSRLWEFAVEHTAENLVNTFAIAAPALNSLIVVAKTLNALSAIHVDIEMEGALPFVRTVDNLPGQTRLLTATVRTDSGKWEMINCARFGLQMFGIDPKVLRSGPLKTGVNWRLPHKRLSNGLPELLVNFDAAKARNSPASGAATSPITVTNEEGISRIFLSGYPQHTSLKPAQLHPVQKTFTVFVDVQPKHFFTDSEESRKAEAIDLAGIILKGIVTPADAVVEAIGETVLRSYLPSGVKEFPLQDWGTHSFCAPNGQTYNSAGECARSCRVSLGNFVGICIPR